MTFTLNQRASFDLVYTRVQYFQDVAASQHSGVYEHVSHASWRMSEYLFDRNGVQIPTEVMITYVPRSVCDRPQDVAYKCLNDSSPELHTICPDRLKDLFM